MNGINIHIHQKAIMRKRRKYNRIHKQIRYSRSSKKKTKNKRLRSRDSSLYQNSLPVIPFMAPAEFNMTSHPEHVIDYINHVNQIVKEKANRCRVFFDLHNIVSTDNGAIGMLLGLINSLSRKHVHSFGNSPRTEEASSIFLNSGFFEHVKLLQGKKSKSIDSFIIQNGSYKTNSAAIGKEIRNISEFLTGQKKSYQPLYSLIGEMISNSIEHANLHKKDKNWFLSVHYDSNRVVVMVSDIGKGIMATLKKKFSQKLKDTLTNTSDVKTLHNLFCGKYQSSTFEPNRNKGLPLIKESYDNNFISNLVVITNNVLLDFNNQTSRELNSNFLGTFYSWEVTNNNIETWKKRNKH